MIAVICLVEFVGPSRVARGAFGQILIHESGPFEGQPLGMAHPQAWVQVTATSQSQTVNTMSVFPALMSDEFISHFEIKPGVELIRAHNGKQKIEAVTSSFRTLEGKRTTFTVLNETHHWNQGNQGHEMYRVLNGNTVKIATARWLAITNAYQPGEDSVAERMRSSWQAVQDGRALDTKMLYDSVEAHPLTPLTPDALKVTLPKIRGDATWLDIEEIILDCIDTQNLPSRSRRMYLNQIVASEDALYGPEHWMAIEDPDAVLLPGDEITLGFDGGRTDDATALVAMRVRDQCAFLLFLQEKPENWPTGQDAPKWKVNTSRVDSAVHQAFQLYDVKGFYADVYLWESYIDSWAEQYREQVTVKASGSHAIAWDMRQSPQKVTRAHERLMQSVFDEAVRYDGNANLRRHALNAVRRDNSWGTSFEKESRESPRKVDAYAALMLAHEALHDLRTNSKPEKKRTGNSYFL